MKPAFTRVLKAPILHFILLGTVAAMAYVHLKPPDRETITITAQTIDALVQQRESITRSRMVLVHVALPNDFPVDGLPMLDGLLAATLRRLQETHLATTLDMVFTADSIWGGAPAGQRVDNRAKLETYSEYQ